MKFQNLLLGIFLVLVSCATSNYDYFKLSKLEKKNYQLDLNSINYRLGNTILDKNNVSDLKIDRKKKIVFVKNKSELKFINLKKIADSTQNKNVNLAVIYGLPFAKGDFGKIWTTLP